MRKSRLLIMTILVIFAMIAMTACGTSSKTNDSNVKKTDQAQTSGNSDKNENDNSGSITTGEQLKWPKELMGNLPEPKGKITVVLKDTSQGQCTVAFSEMAKEDAKNYTIKIKEIGYKEDLEATDAESIIMSGTAKDGSQVCFTYKIASKEGTVIYNSKGINSASDSNAPQDMTDAMPWPKDFIKGVPELTGKIVDVVNRNGNNTTVYLEYVNKADFEKYVDQLKENGYTVESDETSNVESIDFRANNADGDYVHAYLSINEGGNKATVEMEKASK